MLLPLYGIGNANNSNVRNPNQFALFLRWVSLSLSDRSGFIDINLGLVKGWSSNDRDMLNRVGRGNILPIRKDEKRKGIGNEEVQ